MLKVYGKENCSQCEELKGILQNKGIQFEYILDMRQLRIVASKAKIMSAPVVEKDGKFYSMVDFLKEVI